ncbi:kinase [Hirsutella rhossiliensis]
MGTEAAFILQSKISSRNVASELALLFGHIQRGDFNYNYYRPLVKLVIQEAPDSEIWSAVLDLNTTLTRQGAEQTRQVVERKVFEEIRFCTYRDVEGFFEKYFEGKDWTRRALDAYEAMKDHHADGEWADLPDPPVQAEVLDWWFRLQEDFFSEEPRRYYSTTNPKDLVGAEAQRQIDLFVKRKNGQSPDAAHDWGDVDVIGELKASNNNKKATLLQLGRYVRDVFSCQPTRRPGAFDIHEKPERKRKSMDVGQKPSKRSRSNSQRSSQRQNEVTYDVEEAQGTSLLVSNNGRYDNRVFRCLVISPAGRAIHKYEKISELLGALRDTIKAHRSLYLKGNILHRDISENNIIITDCKTNGHIGMLIDLDLAKELGSGRSGARCRTGTMEFMAIEVLQGISHTYRHDLESFFYVLLWLCNRRGWKFLRNQKEQPTPSLLTKWYSGSYREIAGAKRGYMHVDGFEDILEEFPQPQFDCVKPLCRELRGILFSYWDGLFVGSPNDPEMLYGPIIKAFGKAIGGIRAMEG